MSKIEMIIDSVRVSLMNYQRAIILKEKGGERYLPMWVDGAQADAITTGLQKACSSRPLTHDFICSIISKLGAALKYVVVDELLQETYHAKAFLEKEGKAIEIDCRPSDAFATAIRVGAPIFVTEKILQEVGVSTDEISKIDKSGKEPRVKILVVDDEERYLKLVSNLLIAGGYNVDTAVSGIDGLAKIKGNRYSLLITGIRMPCMSGFELYKYVQKIAPSLADKTIVVSGSIEDADTREFLTKNKLPYMAKPFETKQLLKEVNRMLTGGA